jgi:hypothetical protein
VVCYNRISGFGDGIEGILREVYFKAVAAVSQLYYVLRDKRCKKRKP